MHNTVDVIAVWNGGMAFYGRSSGRHHLGGAGVAPAPAIWTVLDGAAFFAVVGQPIGRIGNIINGTSWRPEQPAWRLPTPTPVRCCSRDSSSASPTTRRRLRGAGNAGDLLILLAVRRRGVRPGVVIISYVALYR